MVHIYISSQAENSLMFLRTHCRIPKVFINQSGFFFLPQYCQSSLQSSVQIHTQPKLFPNQIQHFIQKLKANVVKNKKKSNVSMIMDFHTNLNFPLMNCFWMCQIVSLVVFIYLINIFPLWYKTNEIVMRNIEPFKESKFC